MSKKRNKKNRPKPQRNREIAQGKCIFCGTPDSLEKHHCIQKRFGGSDLAENLIPICPKCHRVYHFLTDKMLDHLIKTGKLHEHEIRPPSKEVIDYLKRLVKNLWLNGFRSFLPKTTTT